MTFMRPPPGAGFCISGSTPEGGQITPFELASLSLRLELDPPLPTVGELPAPGAHGACAELGGFAGPDCAGGAVWAAAKPVPSMSKAVGSATYRFIDPSTRHGRPHGKTFPHGRCSGRA